ncbi:MAG: hypothetical protein N2422_03625 [Rhodobacteraceae bacterium]|nr:hypothetical protein [Paracoccaceae bacterium]
MRITCARVLSPRRNRATGLVEATVSLLFGDPQQPSEVRVSVAAPARAPGAPALRHRLAAQAKLALFADMGRAEAARRAA